MSDLRWCRSVFDCLWSGLRFRRSSGRVVEIVGGGGGGNTRPEQGD